VAALNPDDAPMLTMAQDDFHKANWVSSPKFTTPKKDQNSWDLQMLNPKKYAKIGFALSPYPKSELSS
jgi:hypothetical protein